MENRPEFPELTYCSLRADCPFSGRVAITSEHRDHFLEHARGRFPMIISFADYKKLGASRADLLDPKMIAEVDLLIATRQPVPAQIITSSEKDNYDHFSISLFGVLPCGRKFHAKIHRVPLFVDVLVSPGITRKLIESELLARMEGARGFIGLATAARPLSRIRGFSKAPVEVVRFRFGTSFSRREFLKKLLELNKIRRDSGQPIFETSSDKNNQLFAMLAAQQDIPTAGWGILRDYRAFGCSAGTGTKAKSSPGPGGSSPGVLYFEIGGLADFSRIPADYHISPPMRLAMMDDRALSCAWDTETYADTPDVPKPDHAGFQVTAISMLFHWYWSTEWLLGLVVSRFESALTPNTIIIRAGSNDEMLSAFKFIAGQFRPEFWVGFNCGGYDWDNFITLAKRRPGGLIELLDSVSATRTWENSKEESLETWSFGKERIKYSAEFSAEQTHVVRADGAVHIDLMHQLSKRHPRAEIERGKSLDWFLGTYKLQGKYDMPYTRMHSIYRRARNLEGASRKCHCSHHASVVKTHSRGKTSCDVCEDFDRELDRNLFDRELDGPGTAEAEKPKCCACEKRLASLEDVAETNYYALLDCVGPVGLLVKTSMLTDMKEIAQLGFCPLWSAFYRADGEKVNGRLTWACHKKQTAFSSLVIRDEAWGASAGKNKVRDLYPGGKVFPPIYGLHSDQPLTYEGKILIDENGDPELGRPIVGLDFASLYPSLMRCFNICPSKFVATREEALALAAEGYAIYQTPLITYERGEKRGAAGNPKKSGHAWFVRHNGVVAAGEPRITHWVKQVSYVWLEELLSAREEDSTKEKIHQLDKADEAKEPKKYKSSSVTFKLARIESLGGAASPENPQGINQTYEHTPAERIDYNAFPDHAQAHEDFLKLAADGRLAGPDRPLIPGPLRFDGKLTPDMLVRSISYVPEKAGVGLPGESLGVFPWVLHDLAAERGAVKKQLGVIEGLRKQMEEQGLEKIEFSGKMCSRSDLSVEYAKIDGKQKALKVIMNTFYGKSGQQQSSYYNVYVAAGVTTSGQQAITQVASCVSSGLPGYYSWMIKHQLRLGGLSRDFLERAQDSGRLPAGRVNYGDTDSNYISLTNAWFSHEDSQFREVCAAASELGQATFDRISGEVCPGEVAGKIQKARLAWWEAMVRLTRIVGEMFREECNDLMVAWTGTLYLSLAYEEILFPTLLAGKKKYAGIAHVDAINFTVANPKKDIFIRGLDMIKQGFNQQVKETGYAIIAEILDPANTLTPAEITEKHFLTALSDRPSAVALAKKARYKEGVHTAGVFEFVERMKREHANCTDPVMKPLLAPPANGEKFDYVIVSRGQAYTLSGAKAPSGKGDKMEYLRVFQEYESRGTPLVLDMEHYIKKGGLIGLCARFICYQAEFDPRDRAYNLEDNDEFTDYDQAKRAGAVKYLEAIVDSRLGIDQAKIKELGSKYKSHYRQNNSALRKNLKEQVGPRGATVLAGVLAKSGRLEYAAAMSECAEVARRLSSPAVVEAAYQKLISPAGKILPRGEILKVLAAYTEAKTGTHWKKMQAVRAMIATAERAFGETFSAARDSVEKLDRNFKKSIESYRASAASASAAVESKAGTQAKPRPDPAVTSKLRLADPMAVSAFLQARDNLIAARLVELEERELFGLIGKKKIAMSGNHAPVDWRVLAGTTPEPALPFDLCGFE